MSGIAQPAEEGARLLELRGSRALREVAADDDKIGAVIVDLPLDRLNQLRVVSAKVKIGEVKEAGHGDETRLDPPGSD